jgi:hypothetical protein
MALYALILFAHRLKAGGYRNSAAARLEDDYLDRLLD